MFNVNDIVFVSFFRYTDEDVKKTYAFFGIVEDDLLGNLLTIKYFSETKELPFFRKRFVYQEKCVNLSMLSKGV